MPFTLIQALPAPLQYVKGIRQNFGLLEVLNDITAEANITKELWEGKHQSQEKKLQSAV